MKSIISLDQNDIESAIKEWLIRHPRYQAITRDEHGIAVSWVGGEAFIARKNDQKCDWCGEGGIHLATPPGVFVLMSAPNVRHVTLIA